MTRNPLILRRPGDGATLVLQKPIDVEPPAGEFAAMPTVASTGWASFGVVAPEGQIPAGSGLAAGAYPTQLDVKTTWPDGSCRFGIATCKPTATGDLPVAVAADAGGTFT